MRILQQIGVIAVLLSLAGCFQVETVIKVKPDGSGTVEDTVLVSKKLVAQMNEMMQGFAGQSENKKNGKIAAFDMYDPVKLKAKAAEMGKGVVYVAGKRIDDDKFEGYRAVYAFADINKLTLKQNPADDVKGVPALMDDGTNWKEEPVLFNFSRGMPATLTVRHGMEKTEGKPRRTEIYDEAGPDKKPPADADLEQLMKMVEGMRIALAIEVEGDIMRTNATHRDGSRITVMEFDLDRVLGQAGWFAGMKALQMQSLEDAKEVLKNMPGMKMDMNEELTVTFR